MPSSPARRFDYGLSCCLQSQHERPEGDGLAYGTGVCWSRLLKLKLKEVQLPAFNPVGDLAESWEQPDDLTYVFKLRRGVK